MELFLPCEGKEEGKGDESTSNGGSCRETNDSIMISTRKGGRTAWGQISVSPKGRQQKTTPTTMAWSGGERKGKSFHYGLWAF